MEQKKRIIIATGGTGGHIYPALSLAMDLAEYDIKFIGSTHGMESKIIKNHPLFLLNSNKFSGKSLGQKMMTILSSFKNIFKAYHILKNEKPSLVIGFGGYASFPTMVAAYLLGIKTIAYEPNVIMGMANKVISRLADELYVSQEKLTKSYPHAQLVEYPVRKDIFPVLFQMPVSKLKVFVMGGSQGSTQINQLIKQISEDPIVEQLDIKLQTGRELEIDNIETVPFIEDMNKVYNWADVVIARAGVGTIEEIKKMQKPSILIPLKTKDNHQMYNAISMFEEGKGFLLPPDSDLLNNLRLIFLSILMNPIQLKEMSLRLSFVEPKTQMVERIKLSL